jgi:hypothetical protein
MHLIQIFLPLRDNRGKPFAQRHFDVLAEELTQRFGGLTTYMRAPAEGMWKKKSRNRLQHDEIVIYEIMARDIDRTWWKQRRLALEKSFRQEQILIRGHRITLL